MKSSTIKKRLDILCEFYNNLKMQKIVTAHDVDVIREYKKKIKKEVVEKETLEIEEIHNLYNFQFKDDSMEKIKDVFVFLCLTGIRYQDLKDFDPRFILKSKENNGLVYRKAASKTGINYQIPLCKIVIEILKKYNNQLPVFSGQYGNRLIKEALKATGMFDNYTQIIDKETNEYKKRYEAVTMHKGRNTFITNLVDCTPVNELMKYTGHKKLSTLQSYIDVKRPVKMEYIKVFDFE
jgi:integrase